MANRRFTPWERAFQRAWVHYWRKQWYDSIIKNLNLK